MGAKGPREEQLANTAKLKANTQARAAGGAINKRKFMQKLSTVDFSTRDCPR
jgi:hypothetical protein